MVGGAVAESQGRRVDTGHLGGVVTVVQPVVHGVGQRVLLIIADSAEPLQIDLDVGLAGAADGAWACHSGTGWPNGPQQVRRRCSTGTDRRYRIRAGAASRKPGRDVD